jgi:hypothetical protein
MAKKRVSKKSPTTITAISLTRQELAALDKLAKAEGFTRTHMVRTLVCNAAGLASPETPTNRYTKRK